MIGPGNQGMGAAGDRPGAIVDQPFGLDGHIVCKNLLALAILHIKKAVQNINLRAVVAALVFNRNFAVRKPGPGKIDMASNVKQIDMRASGRLLGVYGKWAVGGGKIFNVVFCFIAGSLVFAGCSGADGNLHG